MPVNISFYPSTTGQISGFIFEFSLHKALCFY